MLLQLRVARRWLRAAAFSTSAAAAAGGEQLAAIGLERGRSNAYYNQQLRAALERQDVRGATRIADALHAASPAATATAAFATEAAATGATGAVIWTHNYDALLYALGQRGNAPRALALLDEMLARGRTSARSFNTALVACSKRRDLASATRVLAHMRAAGRTPGAFAYANAINCCAARGGDQHAARQLWAEMLCGGVEPTVEVVNCMLRVLGRASDRSLEALQFAEDAMAEFDVAPDAITVSTLTQSLLFDKHVDAAVSFLERVVRQRKKPPVPVDAGVLNAALDACRQLGDWANASRVAQLIKSQPLRSCDEPTNAATQQLIELCDAEDAAAAPVAWSFADPHIAISTRTKRREQLKSEKQSPAHLRKLLAGIIAALEDRVRGGGEDVAGDAREILRRVTHLKQWEQVFTSNSINDIERFLELCGAAGLELGVEMMNLYLFALGTQPGSTPADRLETALLTLNEMIAQHAVDAMSFKNVLAMCNRLGRLDAAERVLELMKQQGAVSTYAYDAVLNICARKQEIGRAEAYLDELRTLKLAPGLITINTMLKAYASATKKSSRGGAAPSYVPVVEKASPGPRYAQRALKLFQRACRKHKIEPSAATHFSLLRTFVQEADRLAMEDAGDEDDDDDEDEDEEDDDLPVQIAKLIKRICTIAPASSLDTAVFNAAIDYYQRCGDVDAAFGVFNTMKERGFEPNDLTLRLLFAACSRSEQADVGLKFLHFLMDNHAYQPTLDVLNGAIELCASSGSPRDALELFHGIESSGVLQPTEDTFIHVIHAFARQGNVSEALRHTRAMQERFGAASLNAYNRVLQACATATAPLTALGILQDMKEREGLAPNAISYDMVLRAFAKGDQRHQRPESTTEGDDADGGEGASDDDDFDDGDGADGSEDDDSDSGARSEASIPGADVRRMMSALLEEMRDAGIAPSSVSYTRVIAACASRGNVAGVFQFFDDMMGESNASASAPRQLASDASLENYLRACGRAQDLERAMELAGRLKQWRRESGKRTSSRVVLQLLNTYKFLGAWREAVAGLRDLESGFGVRPNALFFSVVMEACNTANEFHLVDQIFETMQNAAAYRNVYPTSESYIEAIYAAEQQEAWVRATNLFLDMQKACGKDGIPPAQLQRIALGRYNESRLRL